jgi:hypothetical protein
MFQIVLSILVLLVSNAFLTFDEETLIILASFFWFDAAGGLFKKMLENELVHKVEAIRAKFVWFLTAKRQLLVELIKLHNGRMSLESKLVAVNNTFISTLSEESISLFLVASDTRRKFSAYSWVSSLGTAVYYDRLVRNLEKTLSVASFSGVLVKPTSAVRPDFSFSQYANSAFCYV